MFTLDPRLERGTLPVCELSLCAVRLMDNRYFPWLILVPKREGLREILDLGSAERHRLMDEIARASDALRRCCAPDKLNVAALGNQVEQLHMHVIARYRQDAAWPRPVWGDVSAAYEDAGPLMARLRDAILAG